MKNTTRIPPGIAVPGQVQTRLGTLRFFDGFPDEASVQKLYDNLDFQRAVQSYLLALPTVIQVATRKAFAEFGRVNSTLIIWENMITPRAITAGGNNNTPYSWMWIDLAKGPLVVEIPPKVLGMINDVWARWVADVGLTGEDQGKGGKYLLLPPGHRGEVPEGYVVVRPRTCGVYILWRSFLDEKGDPKPHIDLIKKTARVYPLAKAGNPPALTFVDVTDKTFVGVPPANHTFWEYLNEVVQAEPSDSQDPVTLGFYQSIGIRKGETFAPDERLKAVLAEAATVGDASARAITYRMREKEAYIYENSAWRPYFLSDHDFLDHGAFLLDSYVQWYFLGTGGLSPSETQKMVGQGSQYAWAFVDAEGRPLDGGRNYKLHLPPNIPVNNFWSAIIHDTQTRSQLQTDQPWPAVSSQDEGFVHNEDGSADVYFGPETPAGKESNWIQTIPGKGWQICFRLYGPLEPWFDRTWRLGEIEPIA